MSSINVPDILIYLTDSTGLNFYVATPNTDGTYTISLTQTPTPVITVPEGWEDIELDYVRHPQYLGVFRSQSQQFKFVKDARAILLSLFYASGGGIQAECMMRIDKFIDVKTGYQTAYTSEIDFSSVDDGKQQSNYAAFGGNPNKEGEFSVSTLDSNLYELLQAYGDTVFNIPIWTNTGTTESPVWTTDAEFVIHDGIKLLYNSTFIGAATNTTPGTGSAGPITYDLLGFAWANGTTGVGVGLIDGRFTIPSMTPYNITQNNGATTFIGNDILQPFFPQGSQSDWIKFGGFAGTDNPNFYSRNGFLLKNAQIVTPKSVIMNVSVSATFKPTLTNGTTAVITNGDTGVSNVFLGFVIFAIGPTDVPNLFDGSSFGSSTTMISINPANSTPLTGLGVGKLIASIPLNSGADTTVNINFNPPPVQMAIDPNYVYVMGIIFDNAAVGHEPFEQYSGTGATTLFTHCGFTLTNLQCTFSSAYNSGEFDPVSAPMLNPSVFPAFRLHQLLEKIIPYLYTTTTDAYGFPIPVPGNPYTGISSFLSNALQAAIGDCVPQQLLITSQYCIHDLEGQSYLSISLNQLFNFCKKVLGCGLAIQPNATIIEIERLSKYFDASTMILDLGANVANMSIKPFNDMAGCNLKLGYTQADTNADFGVDPFITELFFNTPITKIPNTIDWQEDDFLCEQYAIEKIRAQQTNQPVGAGYNPANPSTNNQTVALYCLPSSTFTLPASAAYGAMIPYDPSNNPYLPDTGGTNIHCYQLTQRNGGNLPFAQNVNPAGTTYVYGMYYPDTAYNLELSPCRALQRDGGALLHSVLDLMDAEALTFRNTSVMQYNNVAIGLSGIQSNIGSGLITEFADISISSLPAKLFRPWIFNITTMAPVNMYATMNTNPNGYIQFTWKGVVFKGFIWNIKQKLSASQPTNFQLIAHPSTTNEQLING